ncbi:MAG TPA: ion channel [Casimicrobiaceae bacterium]|nr:ion channel [Casimicrobiaceae bacterium]
MAIAQARERLGRVFYQRCFYLFVVLLVLVGGVPFVEPTEFGRLVTNAVNLFVIIATVAAVGRTTLSFVIAILLAVPTLGFQWLFLAGEDPAALHWSWIFGGALYLAAIVYLLRYVFQREVMTADKLFGAAAGYLMIGLFWAYVFALLGYYYPNAFAVYGTAAPLSFIDGVYFSFTVLTSTGFGDITPLTRQARGLVVVEQVLGALFLAVLIARLAGVYPPQMRGDEE